MPFQAGGVGGVKTLSDLQIDVDKDWKAHSIYNLGNLTPKVDGAYSLGESDTKFDTVYAGLMSDSIYKRNLRKGVVDTSYLTDNAATPAKVAPSVDLEFVRSNDNVVAGDIDAKVDGAYNLGSSSTKFNTAYATSFPGMADLIYKTTSEIADVVYTTPTDAVPAGLLGGWCTPFSADIAYQSELQPVKAASIFDHSNLTVARAADIAYQSELLPVKFADIVEHGNLPFDRAKDIVYHGNFNLGSSESRDKIAETAYGVAKDMVGLKGFTYQITQKKDFAFRTETPDHAYWHRMYNTPAAFETVYQDYTTSMQKKGTTPDKSAPNTADPNPQPGACWSVSMVPDGTQIGGGFFPPGTDPHGMAWDGTYLWDADVAANYVYQLDPTDGSQVGGCPNPGPDVRGVAWDGEYLWTTDWTALYIYHLKTDGTQVGGFASPAGGPNGIAWDGTYLWHADASSNFIYQLKTDGTQAGGFASPTSGPFGLVWDGVYLWHSENASDHIYQFKTDGTEVDNFPSPGPAPRSVAWDGKYLWHNDRDADYTYQLGNAGNFDVNYRIFAK